MTTPGFFEIYPSARPGLPAGSYQATSNTKLTAVPPAGVDRAIPVDDTQFRLHIDAPRYFLPPDQILSTFPPAGSQGDWRERLPQIVLKRRTLPWERNPKPSTPPETAPPWLALIVLADGEGVLSPDVDVSECATSDVDLGPDADVAKGKYVEVTAEVVAKVFPCQDELDLLCHVRKVDLSDTELALGDDDGYLAVVMSSRLPQPAPPKSPGKDAQPLKYTAYLINLEKQLPKLLATEPPVPNFKFDSTVNLVKDSNLTKAPNATLDQLAMNLGPGAQIDRVDYTIDKDARAAQIAPTDLAPYGTSKGLEPAAGGWATGPAKTGVKGSADLSVVGDYKSGAGRGFLPTVRDTYRFPVLVSWDFTCTATGGFARLMNTLDGGLLGTLDPNATPPIPEVALTGHVGLSHRSRHGDLDRSWYRGPFSPQPTVRSGPENGVLPLAHTADQLRKVVPDGREDISLASLYEIGRLLTLSKPTLVAALMAWRRALFGAARARELGELLAGNLLAGVGTGIIGGRTSLEDLIRTQLVGAFTGVDPTKLAPHAQSVTAPRVPRDLADLSAEAVLIGLGADPAMAFESTKRFGADGLGAVALDIIEASNDPASKDRLAMAQLSNQLAERVQQLTVDALRLDVPVPKSHRNGAAAPDELDRLIDEATDRDGGA